MSELQHARQMLDEAERAARAGDFASADELLRKIASIQEAELGALHPELANTLNNLAIVAERRGRLKDAEAFYSRSAMIASATLPPEHPMVMTSRQNLEAFRRARAASTSAPAPTTRVPAQDPDPDLDSAARKQAARPAKPAADARPAAKATPRAAAPPPPEARRPVPPAPQPPLPRPVPSLATRSGSWVLLVVMALLTAGLLANGDYRDWLLREAEVLMREASTPPPTPTPTPTPAPTPAPAPAPTPPLAEAGSPPSVAPSGSGVPPAVPAPPPTEETSPTPAVRQDEDREAASASTSEIAVSTAQLCRSLSTGSWRCNPTGNPVPEGPLVLYTRVTSPRGGSVVHQWYHGGTLRKSVPLKVRANATEGFRTYSRLTIDEPGDWRVEVRTADGELLHEERFSVR